MLRFKLHYNFPLSVTFINIQYSIQLNNFKNYDYYVNLPKKNLDYIDLNSALHSQR